MSQQKEYIDETYRIVVVYVPSRDDPSPEGKNDGFGITAEAPNYIHIHAIKEGLAEKFPPKAIDDGSLANTLTQYGIIRDKRDGIRRGENFVKVGDAMRHVSSVLVGACGEGDDGKDYNGHGTLITEDGIVGQGGACFELDPERHRAWIFEGSTLKGAKIIKGTNGAEINSRDHLRVFIQEQLAKVEKRNFVDHGFIATFNVKFRKGSNPVIRSNGIDPKHVEATKDPSSPHYDPDYRPDVKAFSLDEKILAGGHTIGQNDNPGDKIHGELHDTATVECIVTSDVVAHPIDQIRIGTAKEPDKFEFTKVNGDSLLPSAKERLAAIEASRESASEPSSFISEESSGKEYIARRLHSRL